MTIITAADLRSLMACAGQVTIFQQRWPNGAELSRENLREAARIGLNLDWWARNAPQICPHLQAYDAACEPHRQACETACEQHRQDFEAARERHQQVFEAACEPHLQAYLAACYQHRQAYIAACAEVISDLLGL